MKQKVIYTSINRHGNYILYRGYKNGKPVKLKTKYEPTLYIRSPDNAETKFRNFEDQYLAPVKPGSMSDCRQFCDKYKDIENFKIYGNQNYIHQFISDMFRDCDLTDITPIRINYMDIEVASDDGFPHASQAKWPITSITCKINEGAYHVWTTLDYDPEKSVLEVDKLVYRFNDEVEMLQSFLTWWRDASIDIVTGWNTNLFDIPYLVNRTARIMPDGYIEMFSPWGIVKSNNVTINGRENVQFELVGIQLLDYMDLFKKFGVAFGPQESYKLDHIANVVLKEGKMDYSEYGSLLNLYKENPQKYVDYNIKDTDLIYRMEKEARLLEQCITVAYMALINFNESFGTVAIWDAIIYNYLRRQGVALPPKERKSADRQIAGGYVKDPLIGLHEWVCSFDVNSLYPSIIHQYNLSPEMITGERKAIDFDALLDGASPEPEPGTCVTGLGYVFKNEKKGFLPELVSNLYDQRVITKKKMIEANRHVENATSPDEKKKWQTEFIYYKNQQMAVKLLLNGLYGAMANEYFRFFDHRLAESVTITGQLTIKIAEQAINQYLNKLIGTVKQDYVAIVDTDSCYVVLNPLVKKYFKGKSIEDTVEWLNQACKKKLEPLLKDVFSDLGKRMGCKYEIIGMKREGISNKVICTGKKHYVLNLLDDEGVRLKEPKIKMTGIEAVKSSTPKICRDLIKDCLKIIMNKDEESCQDFIVEARKKFNKQQPEDIAFPRGVSDIEKWSSGDSYKERTPIHVRGSILYNTCLNKYNVTNKYQVIHSGDKIKFIYLTVPNTIHENVIAFPDVLPKEFGLHEYIDYKLQFEKAFVEPINSIISKIGWSVERTNTLEAFFS